jgi:hypothetical protein
MSNFYQIPLIASQQSFTITLNGVAYSMRLIFCDDPTAGWILDIGDSNGLPILCGIPLKIGINLLQQYSYLGLGGGLMAVLSGDNLSIGYTDLSVNAQLYFVVTT